jgi:hypothetical protein
MENIMDSDIEHGEELEKTGFWGKAGAGAIIFSLSTKRFLFPLRSNLGKSWCWCNNFFFIYKTIFIST